MIKGTYATRQVFIDDKELLPDRNQQVFNHSPDGFAWNYSGSGPAQLALALLLEFLPINERSAIGAREVEAIRLHQKFKHDVIAKLPQGNFELEIDKVKNWYKQIRENENQINRGQNHQ